MDQILVNLEKFKIFNHEKVRIDSRICEFHYRLTTLLLFTCTSIISFTQVFGSPINCIQSGSSTKPHPVPEDIMNTFCFTQTTFTYINQDESPLTYPGITSGGDPDDIRYHSYYQWVPIFLFIQALVFLTPHFLWKCKEGSLMTNLLKTNEHYLIMTTAARKLQFKQVSSYLIKRHGSFYVYAYAYLLNILFNTLAVCFNIYSMEMLLRGYFKYLGAQFIDYMWTRRNTTHLTNPLDITFPKMTKCTFYKYGPSGTLEVVDAMCLLPLNNLNEKIFIMLWFWYLILFCISISYSVMKISQGLAINSRNTLLMKRYFFTSGFILDEELKILLEKLDVGQWFVIDIVRLNLSSLHYKDFLKALVEGFRDKRRLQNNNNVILAETGCMGNGQVDHDHVESHEPHM